MMEDEGILANVSEKQNNLTIPKYTGIYNSKFMKNVGK